MTDDEIDALEAGRELDALIAEHVFGWKWYKRVGRAVLLPPGFDINFLYERLESTDGLEREHIDSIRFVASNNPKEWDFSSFPPFPKFSTTWNGMGQVLDELSKTHDFMYSYYEMGHWTFQIVELNDGVTRKLGTGTADTPMLAVCHASLKWALLEGGVSTVVRTNRNG